MALVDGRPTCFLLSTEKLGDLPGGTIDANFFWKFAADKEIKNHGRMYCPECGKQLNLDEGAAIPWIECHEL